jgi:acyl carrier protein
MSTAHDLTAALKQLTEKILAARGLTPLPELALTADLRRDLGLDSLDLAELTVRIQDRYGVDVFAAGVVRTWGELVQRVQHHIEHGRSA